jgi:hypothetical protein
VLSVPCKDAALFQIAALRGDWRSFWDLVDEYTLREPVCPDADLFDAFWCILYELGVPGRSSSCEWWPLPLGKALREESVGTLFCLTSRAAIEVEQFFERNSIGLRDVRRAAEAFDRRISKKEAAAVLAYVRQLLDLSKASSDRFLVGLVNRRGEGW